MTVFVNSASSGSVFSAPGRSAHCGNWVATSRFTSPGVMSAFSTTRHHATVAQWRHLHMLLA
jgi:hypothetical protein